MTEKKDDPPKRLDPYKTVEPETDAQTRRYMRPPPDATVDDVVDGLIALLEGRHP